MPPGLVLDRRQALIERLARDPDLVHLLEAIYETEFTGRFVLDCVNGIPKRWALPQPDITGDLR